MSEDAWEPAIALDVDEFAVERADNLRGIARKAWTAGDKFFLARQHAYFLRAYKGCKCEAHSCSGCKISLNIASKFERDISKLDANLVLAEEEKAMAICDAKDQALSKFLFLVKARHAGLRADREGAKERERGRSIVRARTWSGDSKRNPPPPQEAGDRE